MWRPWFSTGSASQVQHWLACARIRAHIPCSTETFPRGLMLYDAYEVQRSLLAGASKLAGLGAGWLNNPDNPFGYSAMGPLVAASLKVFADAAAPHGKPAFGIESVHIRGKDVPVHEEILLRKPFGQLKHFYREGQDKGPHLLIVAPMSGHYATLLRG